LSANLLRNHNSTNTHRRRLPHSLYCLPSLQQSKKCLTARSVEGNIDLRQTSEALRAAVNPKTSAIGFMSAPGGLALPTRPAGPSSAYGGMRISSSAAGQSWSKFNNKKSTSAGGTAAAMSTAGSAAVVPPLQLSKLDDWMNLQLGGGQDGEGEINNQQGGPGVGAGPVGFWAEVPVSASRGFRSSRTTVSAGGKLMSHRGTGSGGTSSGGDTSRAVSAPRTSHSHH
jgi:hypothetical protein